MKRPRNDKAWAGARGGSRKPEAPTVLKLIVDEKSPLHSKPRQLATSIISTQFLYLEKRRPGRLIFPRCQPCTSTCPSPHPFTAKEYLPSGTGQIENLPSLSVTALYWRSGDDKRTVECFTGLPSFETMPAIPSSSTTQVVLSHCAAANDVSRSRTTSLMKLILAPYSLEAFTSGTSCGQLV